MAHPSFYFASTESKGHTVHVEFRACFAGLLQLFPSALATCGVSGAFSELLECLEQKCFFELQSKTLGDKRIL